MHAEKEEKDDSKAEEKKREIEEKKMKVQEALYDTLEKVLLACLFV